LRNVGHEVGRGTIAEVLKREGIEPAPLRGNATPWSVFLKEYWRTIVAADFSTAEVWTLRGLVTYYVFFLIELPEESSTSPGLRRILTSSGCCRSPGT
jgi:putative transposase